MRNKQRFITAGVTIVAAAAAAHIMQRDKGPSTAASVPPVTSAAAAVIPTIPTPAPNEVTVLAEPPSSPPATTPLDDTSTELSLASTEDVDGMPIVPPPAPETVSVLMPESDEAPVSEMPDSVLPLDMVVDVAPGVPMDPSPDQDVDTAATTELLAPPLDMPVPDLPLSIGAAFADRIAELTPVPVASETAQPEVSDFGLTCGPILSATPAANGLVNLILTAPCRADARVDVLHGPLTFSGMTDALGAYLITMPAMVTEASFIVVFADGVSAKAEADVPSVEGLDRVAVVADGKSGFQIHALEFGATYGEPGHVWADAPGLPDLAAAEGNGYMMRLGDATLENAMVSEVYTFPRAGSDANGVVRLSVEAEVTADNCAKDIVGNTIEPGPSGVPVSISMTVAVPNCDAIGEYLVLKNLLRDLKLASNN